MMWLCRSILYAVLLVAWAVPASGQALGPSRDAAPPTAAQQDVAASPDLAAIIPLATELSGRFAKLDADLKGLSDFSDIEEQTAHFGKVVDDVAARLESLRGAGENNWVRLEVLIQHIREEQGFFEDEGKPLAESIRQLALWQAEWLTERQKWRTWEAQLSSDREPDQLKNSIAAAKATIDNALDLVVGHLDVLLRLQAKGGSVLVRMDALDAAAQVMINAIRKEYLLAEWPPLVSGEYFAQFSRGVWQQALENLGLIAWPDRRYFARQPWTFIGQILLVLAVIATLYRKRPALSDSEHWRFLAARPISAGLFVGILTLPLLPGYFALPVTLKMLNGLIGWFSFSRLMGLVIEQRWKREAAFGVILFFVVTFLLEGISLPLPLYRLYALVATVISLCFCLRWIRASAGDKDPAFYALTLRLASVLCGIILVGQLIGRKGVAVYVFKSLLASLAISLAFLLFIKIIRGGLHWIFFSSPVWKIKQLRSEAERLTRQVGLLVESGIWIFVVLPAILSIWGVYGSVPEATAGLLALGVDAGAMHISVGLVLAAAGTLYGSLLLSWVLPKVVLDERVAGANMERGVRISVGHLIQYFIVFIGLLLTLTALGLDLTKLTIMLSALGVGIGFGLQGVVNNFVSGIILLFEQPVRVGDSIEVSGKWAEIRRIGLRSTTVQTYDKAELIIPNADLISTPVTNWTLSNRQVRVAIAVGVAYGSDVPLVISTLLASAEEHDMIAKSPPPQVLFMNFGESSLDFELRVWVTDVDYRLSVASDLRQEIDRRFREAGIEIAFPQRDLHLRTVDRSILASPLPPTP